MKVTFVITCHIAKNPVQKIVFDIDDEILKEHEITDNDELSELIYSTKEEYHEYEYDLDESG